MPRARLRVIALASLGLLLGTVLAARQIIISTDGSVARDATPAPKGTAVVMGRTLDAVSGKPIGDVVVSLTLTAPPFSAYPAVVSDDQGRFVVRDLPKGPFRFYAVKPGYIPGGYSKRQPAAEEDRFGSSMSLNDAERALDVTLTLWKYAVIEGTVTDETGDPIVGTSVRALPRRIVAGRSQFIMENGALPFGAYTTRTDDRGMYRLDSLPPGDYAVAVPVIIWAAPKARPSVSTSPADATSSSSSGLLSWTGGGRGGGTGVGTLEAGDDRFAIPNFASLVSTTTPPMLAGFTPQGRPLVYETQYFPGSASLGRATVIAVGSGETRSAVDFRLRPGPASKISGVASGPNGPAAQLTLRLVSAEMSSTTSDPEIGITTTDGEGRFVFLGVTPGQYAIRALDVPRPRTTPGTSTTSSVQTGGSSTRVISVSSGPSGGVPTDPTWWAETRVSVADRDVADVTVSLAAGARIRGRVEFEGTAPRPDWARAPSISILRADGQRSANYTISLGRFDDQGRFATFGLLPGQYFLQLLGAPMTGWFFAGAFVGSRDVSILPLEVGSSDVDGVVIKLSDRPPGTIAGIILDSRGQPAPEATALIFPADRGLWVNYGPSPRMVRAVGSGRAGRYVADNLPAGEYLAVAVAGIPKTWAVPESLEKLSAAATRVTLRDHDNVTTDLRVTATPSADVMPSHASSRSAGVQIDVQARVSHGPFVADHDEQTTRDAIPPVVATGTARLAGVISLDAEGRRPAVRATVALTGAAAAGNRTLITNESGRFDFTGLPAGRYLLSASKPAYLSVSYGATRVGGAGTQIILADGQQTTNVVLTIRKGGVITGVIRDERGQSMQGASVQALQFRPGPNGERRLGLSSSQGTGRTDDRGVYRLFGLPPGDYYVSASAGYVNGTARPTTAADIQFAIQPSAASTSAPGAASGGSPAGPTRSSSSVRKYVPLLYPGVPTTDGAQVVKIGIAEERNGVDLALRMVPAVTIEGTIVASGGPLPSNLEVRLLSVSDAIPSSDFGDITSLFPIRVGPDGRFSFSSVGPGQYAVAAMTATSGARGRAGAEPTAPPLWGTTTVEVNGVDISNVMVSLQPGMSVSGRVRFNATTLTAPADLSAIRVSLNPVLTDGQVAMGQTNTNAGPDGSFTFTGLTPGRYNLRATATGTSGWLINAVSAGGQDATDMPFELKSGADVADASIVFSDRPAELTGTLQDASGRAAADYFVVLLSADPTKWRSTNRRVHQVRPIDGKFTFRNLLPGEYVLAAATDLEPGIPSDPELLAALARSGTKVTIAEGEKKVQDVKIEK